MAPGKFEVRSRIHRPGKPDIVVVHTSNKDPSKGLSLREVAMEILTVHKGFLSWVRDGRVVLHKGKVCLTVKKMMGRKVYVDCVPLNRAMLSMYQELIDAEFITPATEKTSAKVVER